MIVFEVYCLPELRQSDLDISRIVQITEVYWSSQQVYQVSRILAIQLMKQAYFILFQGRRGTHNLRMHHFLLIEFDFCWG